MKPETLYFPKDELSHPSVIEWWYFNGHLRDGTGNQYAFMYCLFKADPQKIKLPLLEKIPSRNFYFSHCLLTEIGKKNAKSRINFFYKGLDAKSFSEDLLFIKAEPGLAIKESKLFNYKLKTEMLDLELVSEKPPLLINNIGWIDLKTKDAYYYSLTSLATEGAINFDGKEILVSGKSWMDHQWAETAYSSEDKWIWFSLQLDNQAEILCFEYGDKKKTRLATISYPDGHQDAAEAIFKELGGKWQSPKTEAVYQLNWQIEIPEKNVVLTVKPKSLKQEIIFGSINYWEGPIEVAGEFGGKKVSGDGFLELVGAPMGKSVAKLYLEEAKKFISDFI